MGRYGRWTEERITRLQKEGRGKGTGATYRPWLEVTDLSSRGDSRRVFSPLTQRTHHLLSTIEFDFFVLAEFTPDIVDIREQYPLDRAGTLSIAAQLGIEHPRYPDTQVNTVMTCDFLVTRERNGERTLEAYNCKSAAEANQARSINKLEIQRRYFEGCEVPHFIVFDTMLPTAKIKNIKWIREASLAEGEQEPNPGYFRDHSQRFLADIIRPGRPVNLSDYCQKYDERTGAPTGTGLRVVRMLLQQRLLVTDLTQPDLLGLPVSMFRHAEPHLRVVGA